MVAPSNTPYNLSLVASHLPLFFLTVAVAASCGGRSALGVAETQRAECLVALRLDVCCPIPKPAEAIAVQQDPCLVAFPFLFGVDPIPDECAARRPKLCDDGCGPLNKRPASVFARRDELPPCLVGATRCSETSGQCIFADECAEDSECVVATDTRHCCGCSDAWPASYVASQACVFERNSTERRFPAEDCLPLACDPGACPFCPGDDGSAIRAVCHRVPGVGPVRCTLAP